MASGSISVLLKVDPSGFKLGMENAENSARKFKRTMEDAGHTSVSQMQASSAAIRVIEGNMTNNIRAAEKFIATIPGVGAALKAAFPVVGAIAFAGVVGEVVGRIYEFNHTLQQTRNVANESFAALTEAAQKNADTLRVTNDKLEQQIAQLEHKPINNLALALDEARLRADELAGSLNKDFESFKKIIEETQKGSLSGLFNRGVDKELGGGMQDRLANIRTLARQQRDALRAGDQGGAADADAKLRAAQDEALRFADSQVSTRTGIANQGTVREAPYAKVYGNQGLNLDAINQFKDLISGQEDTADQQKRNTADQERLRMLTESNKAQADLLKQFEEQLTKQKAQYGVSVADELAFWSARINAFSQGSEQFHTVQMDQYRLQAELYQKLMEGKKKYLESSKSDVEGNNILGRAQQALITGPALQQNEQMAKAAQKYNETVAQGEEIWRKNATAIAETSIAISLAQGSMSRLEAAQAMAAIHAQDHADALALVNKQLQEQIDLINQQPAEKMSDQEKASAIANAQNEAGNRRNALNGAYARTQAQDAADISGNTISGAVKSSLSQMVQSFTDMAENLKNVIPRTIESLNDDIAKLATGQGRKGDFGRTFKQAGEGLVKTGLQGAEGYALKKLGLGGALKRDGSTEMAALWVQIARGNSAMASSGSLDLSSPARTATLPLASLIPGGSFIQPFIPHFAGGGDVLANHPAIIGERGPELWMPSSAGRIVPNHALVGGGSTGHTFNIDARGATDPAAVHAAIMRAAPHIVGATIQTQHSAGKRTPRGR